MRKLIILIALIAVPAIAQNTDIESLSGLQFNFGNPGARSLGMGGAFLGLADDASAAEANPAGLTILRKPEVSVEGRNYQEQQVFSTSGTCSDAKSEPLLTCLRQDVGRWSFPRRSDEYAAQVLVASPVW